MRRGLSGISCGVACMMLVVVFGCCALSGCAPRGETKTLDEVFNVAKARYETAILQGGAEEEARTQLAELSGDFEAFLQGASEEQARQAAAEISAELQKLLTSTGYTTRPAMNELVKSFRGMTLPDQRETGSTVEGYVPTDSAWNLDESARKLLVARTYTALAQELETTSFRVEPKGVN